MYCYRIRYDVYYADSVGAYKKDCEEIVVSETNSIADIEDSQEMKTIHTFGVKYKWCIVTSAEFLGECRILTPQPSKQEK